mgnify:CR=1 FL=1
MAQSVSHQTHTTKVPWHAQASFSITTAAYVVSQLATTVPLLFALLFTNWDYIQTTLLNQPWMNFVLTGVSALGLGMVIYLFTKYKKYRLVHFKLQRPPLKILWLVAGTYIVYLLASIVVTAVVQVMFPGFNAEQEQLVGYDNAEGWQLALAFIGLVIIPPFAEEFVFRGFLYQGLRDNWHKQTVVVWGLAIAVFVGAVAGWVAGVVVALGMLIAVIIGRKRPMYAAAIVTSVLFGLVHMQWNVAIDTFLLSFALIYVFEKTNNLWAAIALHALKNGIAFIGIFILMQ